MFESTPAKPEVVPPNLGDLVSDAVHQAQTLVQAELSLAKRDLKREVAEAFGSLLWIAAALIFAQAALTTLGVLAVIALGAGVASLGVVLLLAAVAGSLLSIGVRALKQRKLPQPTARLVSDAKQVMEAVK
jgi:uncharacterized membrane protein YqjE